ncbi:RNA polymerase recycling motor ATPase HelR [Citricoccus sp. NPDC055426]|uniref:RNA polymerase recycling motor ATPase HelR n=1 Tax=Citricoccus sp. NPDC055426 TaxID=3155536 RepID=UPI0034332AD9
MKPAAASARTPLRTPPRTTVFALPDRLAAKAEPHLIADDEAHFAALAATLRERLAEDSQRLAELRRQPRGSGEYALERDAGIRRMSSRLTLLDRFGPDLTLGRMVTVPRGAGESGQIVYIGRMGLTDGAGRRLLIDWRSPAARPFFAATHARPEGLASRRRYRWTRGAVTDYWDEVFTLQGLADAGRQAALDDQSAFIASLGAHRTGRMRDVLGTIQADQDAVIRAGSRGALVVDGGPGTGKTVVALHRTAQLLYADERLRRDRGGILFVGPHQPYLAYVADVLPSLGEDGVLTTTVPGLLPEGGTVDAEADPAVAVLKGRRDLVDAVEPAVRLYEEPPTRGLLLTTPWTEVWLSADDWAEAFSARDTTTPHNEARGQVWAALLEILVEKHGAERDPDTVDAADPVDAPTAAALVAGFEADPGLREAFARSWPLLRAEDIVGDLFTVPAYLRRCAPALDRDQVRALQRAEPQAWTTADLPILDAARRRIGDPSAAQRQRWRDRARAEEAAVMDRVIDDLVAADDSDLLEMTSLRTADMRDRLVDQGTSVPEVQDPLAGPFGHIVVDEAQELTDAAWQMLLARCPSGSFTIVGDRAQARHGFTESWVERLGRVGHRHVEIATLTVNYRTPREVMAEAAPVIRAALPDANVPTSIRDSGVPVRYGTVPELDPVVRAWLDENADGEGAAVVIGAPGYAPPQDAGDRVRSLSPSLAKGLEFDLVVLVDPERFGTGVTGAVDRYVAMTRATQRLVVLGRG